MTDLRFADDVALITTSVKDMEVQLNELNQESKKIGLNIHKGKTKYMTNFQSDDTIVIENEIIEKVDRYKIPGSNCDDGKPNTRRSHDQDKGRMELLWQIQRYTL